MEADCLRLGSVDIAIGRDADGDLGGTQEIGARESIKLVRWFGLGLRQLQIASLFRRAVRTRPLALAFRIAAALFRCFAAEDLLTRQTAADGEYCCQEQNEQRSVAVKKHRLPPM
jgi:hypothetical protein